MMKLIEKSISLDELSQMSGKMFHRIVKAVVDVERGIMAVDAEMHVDLEDFLLEQGSEQPNLWGINFHPTETLPEKFVEFDSMINIRPLQGNRSRGVDNLQLQSKILKIVDVLVKR